MLNVTQQLFELFAYNYFTIGLFNFINIIILLFL